VTSRLLTSENQQMNNTIPAQGLSHWWQGLDAPLADFIRRLPKTEHHLHIEGATPYQLLRETYPGRFPEVPEHWDADYRFDSFQSFLEILAAHGLAWFESPDRYHLAAREIFKNASRQNVRYMELSFDAFFSSSRGHSVTTIAEAILSAAPEGLTVRVFLGMTRDAFENGLEPVVRKALQSDLISGLDLHGIEPMPLREWTVDIWREAHALGKVNKAHAGEFGPAENVLEVIERLGVKRVQHGVRAAENPDLVKRLRDEGIALDVCPISNWRLQVINQPGDHPIRQLVEAGVTCTVSTDDPFLFNNHLEEEYAFLASALQFSKPQLLQVVRNGVQVALLPESVKSAWLAELDAMS
jgi:adenosine deaminase